MVNISNKFPISLYIPISASVDVTAETNFPTDSAELKHDFLSRAKLNIRYQTGNDERGVQYHTIARLPIYIT